MTVVLALENEGKVILGGDAYCSSGITLDKCDTPKVFQIGPLGVGICGSIKAEQIFVKVLKREFKKKKLDVSREWIEDDLTSLVREEMLNSGLIGPDENMPDDSSFLIAFEGKVYLFESDFSVWRSPRGYQAIGAGANFAKGAMEALLKDKSLSPEEKVLRSLQAADELCAYVMPPFNVIAV